MFDERMDAWMYDWIINSWNIGSRRHLDNPVHCFHCIHRAWNCPKSHGWLLGDGIDPTALLPRLFAGDSQGFPRQLGSHTAPLFPHQMARPTPSGCRTPPGDEALTSICLACYARRTGEVRDYRANHIIIKISAQRKDFQTPGVINGTREAGKLFLQTWLSLLIQQIAVECLLGRRDAVANKTVLTLKEVTL